MLTTLIIIAVFTAGIYIFLKTPKFGAAPKGERLQRIINSPNSDGKQFQNINYTPQLADGATYFTVIKKVGSSRVDLQACKLEYSIVSPK